MTQTQKIRAHILAHNSITPLEALRKFGSFRLAARINELRKAGMAITSVMVSSRGKRYARYVMG